MKTKVAWFATFLAQALLLFGMVAREEFARSHGTKVVLAVGAIDPMDVLSGRYVSVPLKISTVDLESVSHPAEMPQPGETAFVRLEKRQDVFEVAEIAAEPAVPGGLWARATVSTRTEITEATRLIQLDFGVDRFYIPETGNDPSFARRASGERVEIRVAARIAPDGRIVIEDMLIDGVPYEQWNSAQPLTK